MHTDLLPIWRDTLRVILSDSFLSVIFKMELITLSRSVDNYLITTCKAH